MDKAHFPGYSRCATCQEVVSEKDIHNHILNCRPKSMSEKQLCVSCNQHIDIKLFQEHMKLCNKQTNSNLSSKKKCPICEQLVEDLPLHCETCDGSCGNDENNNSGYETPRAGTPVQMEKKQCVICSEDIDQSDYLDHVSSCSIEKNSADNRFNETNSDHHESSIQIDKNSLSKESNVSQKKLTKFCILCSQQIDESLYEDHLTSCSNDQHQSLTNTDKNIYQKKRNISPYSSHIHKTSSTNSNFSNKKQRKRCVLCFEDINESDYEDHVSSCSNDDKPSDDRLNKLKNDSNSNLNSYDVRRSKKHSSPEIETNIQRIKLTKTNQTKVCPSCSDVVDEIDYEDHLTSCLNDYQSSSRKRSLIKIDRDPSFDTSNNIQDFPQICSSSTIRKSEEKKECIICSKSIDDEEYVNHVQRCFPNNSPGNDNQTIRSNAFSRNNREDSAASSACATSKTRKDCIICFKPIDQSEYENHVLACLGETDNRPSNQINRTNLKCFTCNRSKNGEGDLFCSIPCHSHHNHCLSCIKHSMEEFARNREVPVCHKIKCDYELSRHDISSIPVERRLSDRLLKLVKGQQRPFCSKCHFYIDINDNENFDEHFESCDDLIPCEYCQLPYPFQQLEIHYKQCRMDKTSLNEKLINFILPRTKYPFTKEQIRFFIQQHKNRRMPLDPSSIIESLAIYGSIFPYDMPTRDCDVCMEARPYDDIYVFDCADSHKLCYTCYYQSCQTKMNNGEILTCALCTNPLRDGELNQLRIPIEELKKIREYQIRKTFDAYSSRTRGVIKCPKQNCTWVAEAADPNERFRVKCPICQNEFCSLCNQQYHYRTTCQQLPQITQRWFFWCQTERTRYLTMRAQQDATFATQLNDYNRQTKENENRNRDLRRRYDELMNDEQYKGQNCRLCPSCKRVVQRLEGCDAMVCGQDAHGGNVQSGCGTKFNWTQAAPYTVAATKQPKQTIVDLPKPENPVVHHNGVKCDQCQNDVNGIRFDCVHCPALTFCEKCEQQATLNHSRENQAYEQQQHVFKLIMTPEEEALQL